MPPDPVTIPPTLIEELLAFLRARLTGNITVNVREGQVMGAKVEKHVKL